METDSKSLFRDLTADDPNPETTQIESLCMNCYENVNKYLPHELRYLQLHVPGTNKNTVDQDSFLQGSCDHVIFLRALRVPEQRNTTGW